jgi:hypothetical protein
MRLQFRRERDGFKVIHVTTVESRAIRRLRILTTFIVFSLMVELGKSSNPSKHFAI